jgi:hypothetical protein
VYANSSSPSVSKCPSQLPYHPLHILKPHPPDDIDTRASPYRQANPYLSAQLTRPLVIDRSTRAFTRGMYPRKRSSPVQTGMMMSMSCTSGRGVYRLLQHLGFLIDPYLHSFAHASYEVSCPRQDKDICKVTNYAC